MENDFRKSVLSADVGKSSAQRSLLSGQLVHLFVIVSGEAAFAGTATLSKARTFGETFLRRGLHIARRIVY